MTTKEMINKAAAISGKIMRDMPMTDERWMEATEKATSILNAGNRPILAIGLPMSAAIIAGSIAIGKVVNNASNSKIAGTAAGIGTYYAASNIIGEPIFRFFAKKMLAEMEELAQEYDVDISNI